MQKNIWDRVRDADDADDTELRDRLIGQACEMMMQDLWGALHIAVFTPLDDD